MKKYFLLALLAVISCTGNKHGTSGDGSAFSARPSTENEGVPGYIIKPKLVNSHLDGGTLTVSAPSGAVAAKDTSISDLRVAVWNTSMQAIAQLAQAEGKTAAVSEGNSIGNIEVAPDGGFAGVFQNVNLKQEAILIYLVSKYDPSVVSIPKNRVETTALFKTTEEINIDGSFGALFTPSDAAAPVLTVLSAVSETVMQVDWTVDAEGIAALYLERKSLGGAWATLTPLAIESTTYSDSSVPAFGEYTYRIREVRTDGVVLYSNEKAKTPPWSRTTAGGPFTVDFNSNAALSYFTLSSDATHNNGKIWINHSPYAGGGATAIGANTRFNVTGDFDVSVAYSDLSFPNCTYSAIGLSAGRTGIWYNIERRFQSNLQIYKHKIMSEVNLAWDPDSSSSGVFRISRTGNILRLFGGDGSSQVTSTIGTTEPLNINLYGRDDSYGCAAQGAFDNLTIQ